MFGFLNINKPSGITSNKVISVLRNITGIKQIGHAGTLDPLASGVLPVAIGKASKLIDYLPENKEYTAELVFGKISDTYDIEGNIEIINCKKVTEDEIKKAIIKFRGETTQIPPAYSAVHYNGKRLYELARKGEVPKDIPQRQINIYKNEITDFDFDKQTMKLQIACSKGTYIRTIIHDIGQELKCGAIMTSLTRRKSSGFNIENSVNLSYDLTKEYLTEKLINPIDILDMTTYQINDYEENKISNGNKFLNKKNLSGNILLVKKNKIYALAFAENEYIQPKKVLL